MVITKAENLKIWKMFVRRNSVKMLTSAWSQTRNEPRIAANIQKE
jgi:hypothetical protein